MFPVIDFRNGRYQGETKNQLPHGLGFFIDKNFMFCLAEWIAGEIKGHTIVIYPSGRIFFGEISYREPENMYSFELAEDHVQLITIARPKRNNQVQKLAAILPLLRVILDIDNTDRERARILAEYQFSLTSQAQNLSIVANILKVDKSGLKQLNSYKNFIQYFRDKFLNAYPEILQFIVQEDKGRKEYFIGLRGEGLGIKIEPIEELALNMKRTGKVYIVRAVGYFTKENQLRDLGLKTLDNYMKGNVYEQGIFSLPETLTKYEQGKRPINCSINFHNYIKRSLFYRDKVLNTEYVYGLENFVHGFNQNLRKVETERLAQHTIESPNNKGQNLAEIERLRREKEKQVETFYKSKESTKQMPNPYNPNQVKVASPQYNLKIMKEEIYRSASKKKALPAKIKTQYYHTQFVDPNYQKVETYSTRQPLIVSNRPFEKPSGLSPLIKNNRSKSPYQYLDQLQSDSKPVSFFTANKYRSPRNNPNYSHISRFDDQNNYKSPPLKNYHRIPYSEEPPSHSFIHEEAYTSKYPYDRPQAKRPKYNYHFTDDHEYEERPSRSPIRNQRR